MVMVHIYVANEKGDYFERIYTNVKVSATINDIYAYRFNSSTLSLRLNPTENNNTSIPFIMILEKNRNIASIRLSTVDSNTPLEKKFSSMPDTNEYIRQSDTQTFDSWKQLVHTQLQKAVDDREIRLAEVTQSLKNTQEYYNVLLNKGN